MMKIVRIAVAFLIVSASPAWAGEIKGTCFLRFVGISTLHDFTGTVRCQPFSADLVRSADGGTSIPGVEVDVLVEEMDTGNNTRDGQMREMFQSDRFPRINGTVRAIDVDGIRREIGKEGGGKAFFDLTLRVRDVERTIQAAATNLREEGNQVGFDVEFLVSLKYFGLKAPSFLGIFRVRDKVTVTGNVRLEVSSNKK
ncbi:MAG: YceI family protein [Candidatus Deferrimicrobiaceae bacterium]